MKKKRQTKLKRFFFMIFMSFMPFMCAFTLLALELLVF